MTVDDFIHKWQRSQLKERSASQEHFLDLCRLLGQATPAEADPNGEWFTFEKGQARAGGAGWADVWRKGCFAWEYKGKRKDLGEAYQQVNQYREELGNPPLLIVCDMWRFEVHTNFTDTVKEVHRFTAQDLTQPKVLRTLTLAFTDPAKLKPLVTPEGATRAAAAEIASLAARMTGRKEAPVDPRRAAHFVMRLVFCMFAQDIGVLPDRTFERVLVNAGYDGGRLHRFLQGLFRSMRDGSPYGPLEVLRFNGGLFDDDGAVELEFPEIDLLRRAAILDWSQVSPALFGTLLERSLDPAQRHKLGAHYTSEADIERILGPVLRDPLRREWDEVRGAALARIEAGAPGDAAAACQVFLERVRALRVLDPACGSGNFLYMALRTLHELERLALRFQAEHGLGSGRPQVSPRQLYGFELNPYAQELAQVVVWIGHLQWLHQYGIPWDTDPVLQDLSNIRHADAIVDDVEGAVFRPDWPVVDVIAGNPPFLGGKMQRRVLGEVPVDRLFSAYEGRVPREADLVCYWFDRAREQVEHGAARAVGLVATNSLRGGANRAVLEKVAATCRLVMAWSDEPWIQGGASVRVSLVAFDDGSFTGLEGRPTLDGVQVDRIAPDLTAGVDLTRVRRLRENLGVAFMGDTKGGAFDIGPELAAQMLSQPNPHGRPNREVVRRWVNGRDVVQRDRGRWIIDFGTSRSEAEAALYEAPFEYVKEKVKPVRGMSRSTRPEWWIHERPRVEMRQALAGLERYIATPTVSKHRLFVSLNSDVLPDHQLIVIARDDWFTFGVLHSRWHEEWSLRLGSWLGVGNDPRYTPTTTFETFPFPDAAPGSPGHQRVTAAAEALAALRSRRLEADAGLTLTRLYNHPPTWLTKAHTALDDAVRDAYGWPPGTSSADALARLVVLNGERGAAGAAGVDAGGEPQDSEEPEAG